MVKVDKNGLFKDLTSMLADCMDEAAKRLAKDMSDDAKHEFYIKLSCIFHDRSMGRETTTLRIREPDNG